MLNLYSHPVWQNTNKKQNLKPREFNSLLKNYYMNSHIFPQVWLVYLLIENLFKQTHCSIWRICHLEIYYLPYSLFLLKGWSDSTAYRVLALHVTEQGSVLGISNDPPTITKCCQEIFLSTGSKVTTTDYNLLLHIPIGFLYIQYLFYWIKIQ